MGVFGIVGMTFGIIGFCYGITGMIAFIRLEKLTKTLKEKGILEENYRKL